MIFKSLIFRKIASFKRSFNNFLQNTFDHVFRGGMFSLIMITLSWIAIFLYVIFYYAYVPASSHSRSVYLQVKSSAYQSKLDSCTFPFAYVRLTKRQKLLMMGQQYKFFINLEMPESPINKQLGMFMVCLQLNDKNGRLISRVCRSNMLHYRSELLYWLKILVFSPLFIFGSKEEKQNVAFELYSDYEDDLNHPVTDVYVEVQACNIEIYSTNLQIHAHLTGLRYFMYWWPITSAVFGIAFNICVVFFTISLSMYNKFFVNTAPVRVARNILKKYNDIKKSITHNRLVRLIDRTLKLTSDDILMFDEYQDNTEKEEESTTSLSDHHEHIHCS